MLSSPDGWIYFPKPNRRAALRLFCFPGAGSSASLFFSWPQGLPNSIEVAAVQLPGRTLDLDLSPDAGLSVLIAELTTAIQSYLDLPFVFFAHSGGTQFAFEVARELRRRNAAMPTQFFLACFPPPHLSREEGRIRTFPTEHETLEYQLTFFNDVLAEQLDEAQKKRLAALLTRDFRVWREYSYREDAPLGCPITVFGASEDQLVKNDSLDKWADLTTGEFHLEIFEGDHFFFYQNPQPMLKKLVAALRM